MYYLAIIVTMAASLAASDIVSEISSEYFAHYVIENDPADIGLKAPPTPDTKTAQATETQGGGAASSGTGAADPGKAGEQNLRDRTECCLRLAGIRRARSARRCSAGLSFGRLGGFCVRGRWRL